MRQQELIKNICHFKSRRDLYFFLMNTLLQLCLTSTVFFQFINFKSDLRDNMLNTTYLQNHQSKLCSYLILILCLKGIDILFSRKRILL